MMPRSAYLPLMGHELHVMEWGEPTNPALVMWHGLARNGRDFDELARALSETHFVLCPDTIGRGFSSWSDAPEVDYVLPNYARMAMAMLDHYGIARAAWFGTSMGGQIGITVAGDVAPERITALVINDIGPVVPDAALDRIVTYSADLPTFERLTAAESWLREVYVPFGPAHDTFWRRMAEASVRRRADGRLTLHYDPRIIEVLDADRGAMDLWSIYDRISAPTHVIRGLTSDLLTEEIATEMTGRGPKPEVTVFDTCGHAPSLSSPEDTAFVAGVLRQLAEKAPVAG
ncbi:alpha/beta hydrolase [Maritimibacter sp. UBA3975]|uniref:alpha/beta fold hydrolase n=1 Tax=Maritimibacter sp. UBA3975 TaxID=1946833 RepID=UPI0025B8B8DB|nr:alpha/beta hydrolase [Maritimibacter sp. UBA3975]|tara:strand:+ start:21625 stop:22488 length:864 start_codon:yes stop_codon:yes gene_type:complete